MTGRGKPTIPLAEIDALRDLRRAGVSVPELIKLTAGRRDRLAYRLHKAPVARRPDVDRSAAK